MKSITTWICVIVCVYKEVFFYLHKYTKSNTEVLSQPVTFPQRFAVCNIAVNQEILHQSRTKPTRESGEGEKWVYSSGWLEK